jgi:DNA replication and repair protein RecF
MNAICGGNGQGKTNLLEAIYLLSTGRSFRSNHLQELISHGKNFFYIEANILKDGIDQTLSFYYDGREKKICHQKNLCNSFSALLGLLPSVLHAPDDRDLLSGAPSIRRRFLNIHLSQEDPLYTHHLSRFFLALKQRNFLLKTKNTKTLPVWEEEMAISAEYLIKKRGELLQELNAILPAYLSELAKEEKISLRYQPSFSKDPPTCANYRELLEKNRAKELYFGATFIGPHRDDWAIYFQEKQASAYASEGQKKSFLLGLRLSEWKRLSKIVGEPILMHLDDVAIHLDPKRQSLLQPLLSELSQVFFTSPTPLFEDNDLLKTYTIENGKIRSC